MPSVKGELHQRGMHSRYSSIWIHAVQKYLLPNVLLPLAPSSALTLILHEILGQGYLQSILSSCFHALQCLCNADIKHRKAFLQCKCVEVPAHVSNPSAAKQLTLELILPLRFPAVVTQAALTDLKTTRRLCSTFGQHMRAVLKEPLEIKMGRWTYMIALCINDPDLLWTYKEPTHKWMSHPGSMFHNFKPDCVFSNQVLNFCLLL